VKISKSAPRAMPTRVRPAASAVRTASAVGAETAISSPGAGDHGLLHHVDRDTAGNHNRAVGGFDPERAMRADQLVERIVAADILAHADHALEPGR
jgi:hypothetical protein